MTQIDEIKKHLEDGRELSPLAALSLYGCFRLSARIHELRKRGMTINTRMMKANNKTFASYKLAG